MSITINQNILDNSKASKEKSKGKSKEKEEGLAMSKVKISAQLIFTYSNEFKENLKVIITNDTYDGAIEDLH